MGLLCDRAQRNHAREDTPHPQPLELGMQTQVRSPSYSRGSGGGTQWGLAPRPQGRMRAWEVSAGSSQHLGPAVGHHPPSTERAPLLLG